MTEQERTAWAEAYRFYEQYKGLENTQENWQLIADVANKMCEESGNDPMLRLLLIACLSKYDEDAGGVKSECVYLPYRMN